MTQAQNHAPTGPSAAPLLPAPPLLLPSAALLSPRPSSLPATCGPLRRVVYSVPTWLEPTRSPNKRFNRGLGGASGVGATGAVGSAAKLGLTVSDVSGEILGSYVGVRWRPCGLSAVRLCDFRGRAAAANTNYTLQHRRSGEGSPASTAAAQQCTKPRAVAGVRTD